MYLDHFHLREMPFSITPNPRFLYLTRGHRQALDHLLFGVRQRKGFIVLTGDVGTGKTTLCRALLDELDSTYTTAMILNPRLSETQLLRAIVAELGVTKPRADRFSLLQQLNNFLLDEWRARRDCVLVIDEAQHLSIDALEQVRLLSNLETDDRKLLQIVMCGQTELAVKLAHPRLRQLSQRITVRGRVASIARDEIATYISHRLEVAGGLGTPSFDPESVEVVFEHTGGVPRLVNAVCDLSLLAAFAGGGDRVHRSHAETAVHELQESLT